jgi:hypothetical protein
MTRCYIVEKVSQMGAGLVTKDKAFFPIWETSPFPAAYPSASILAQRLAAAPSKEIVGRVRNLAGQIPSVRKVEKCMSARWALITSWIFTSKSTAH